MAAPINTIREVTATELDKRQYRRSCTGCIVLSKDNQLLLQHRPENWRTFPGCLATFGGEIETGETPVATLQRELHEELGAIVKPDELIYLGAITEAYTNHSELIFSYFWHDRNGVITGCFEGEARLYPTVSDALHHPKIMDDVRWMLARCLEKGLLKH